MGGCQNYGPFLGTLNIRGRIVIGIQKGTIILTTNHIYIYIQTCRDEGLRFRVLEQYALAVCICGVQVSAENLIYLAFCKI